MKRFRKMKDNPIDLSEQNTKYQIFGHGERLNVIKMKSWRGGGIPQGKNQTFGGLMNSELRDWFPQTAKL